MFPKPAFSAAFSIPFRGRCHQSSSKRPWCHPWLLPCTPPHLVVSRVYLHLHLHLRHGTTFIVLDPATIFAGAFQLVPRCCLCPLPRGSQGEPAGEAFLLGSCFPCCSQPCQVRLHLSPLPSSSGCPGKMCNPAPVSVPPLPHPPLRPLSRQCLGSASLQDGTCKAVSLS